MKIYFFDFSSNTNHTIICQIGTSVRTWWNAHINIYSQSKIKRSYLEEFLTNQVNWSCYNCVWILDVVTIRWYKQILYILIFRLSFVPASVFNTSLRLALVFIKWNNYASMESWRTGDACQLNTGYISRYEKKNIQDSETRSLIWSQWYH